MGKMSLTSCRALSTPGKFSNVDRYGKPECNMKNYSTFKLELLALKWAVTEKFKDYLIGTKCTVYTDNNPLTYVQTSAKLGALEQCWAAELARFDLDIRYRSGKTNVCAKGLSRSPVGLEYDLSDSEMVDVQGIRVVPLDLPCTLLKATLPILERS